MAAVDLSLDDLTIPRVPGAATLRAVLNRSLPLLAGEYLTLAALPLPEATRAPHAAVRARVESLLARDPRRVVRVLRRPTHAALLEAALARGRDGSAPTALGPLVDELDLITLLDLAARGDLEGEAHVARPARGWPLLRSMTLGTVIEIEPSVRSITLRTGEISADGAHTLDLRRPGAVGPLRAAIAYHTVLPGITLATTDNNPAATQKLHPEREGNALDLGGCAVEAWVSAVRAAFVTIDRFLPELGAEMRVLLQLLVPVGHDAERHFSCSYEGAPGAIYLSLHPNEMTMAEALVHEFQHNKLHALLRLDPLIEGGRTARYRSPVRPDPRPLLGVLLAVHAFQPVARLYEAMTAAAHPLSRGRDWDARFREILRLDREALATLREHARPTRAGARVLAEIEVHEAHFAAYERARWA